jgi:hypothetical protein
MNDATKIDKNRQTNLLNALALPTKRPFKSQFMNASEKMIHSMVQRLSLLDKVSTKEKAEKREKSAAAIRKRDAKIQEKRDAKKKELKKLSYKKGGKGAPRK